jgi:hypothetical protein
MHCFDFVVTKPMFFIVSAGTVPGSTIMQQPPLKYFSGQSESISQENGGNSV